jgi:peptidoglycan/xylan/chitin deacetylase (PgdA/CDA1 family)
MLSRRSLAELTGVGIDIGAHTRRHPILVRLSDDEAWTEIEGSRRDLAELLGKPVALFAYPNGKAGSDYAPTHVRMAREAGYRAALTTEWGVATRTTDLYAMPRFTPWRTDALGFDLQLARNLRAATA